nr:nucleic acid-binding, OB-fold protein [Tanacetum cinerariifolium]
TTGGSFVCSLATYEWLKPPKGYVSHRCKIPGQKFRGNRLVQGQKFRGNRLVQGFDTIPAATCPNHYFEFISYNQLESKLPKPDENNKMHYPVLKDYIRCVRSVSDIDNIGDPNRSQSLRRKIDDEMAVHFGQANIDNMEQPVIIAVSSCRVSRYRGQKFRGNRLVQAATFPNHYFEFISYNQLESKLPKPDENNKMHYPVLTDYIRCVRSVGDIDNIGDPNRSQSLKRKIDVQNLNGNIVELTL